MKQAKLIGTCTWQHDVRKREVPCFGNKILRCEFIKVRGQVLLYVHQNLCLNYLYDVETDEYLRVSENTGNGYVDEPTIHTISKFVEMNTDTVMYSDEREQLDEWLRNLLLEP